MGNEITILDVSAYETYRGVNDVKSVRDFCLDNKISMRYPKKQLKLF